MTLAAVHRPPPAGLLSSDSGPRINDRPAAHACNPLETQAQTAASSRNPEAGLSRCRPSRKTSAAGALHPPALCTYPLGCGRPSRRPANVAIGVKHDRSDAGCWLLVASASKRQCSEESARLPGQFVPRGQTDSSPAVQCSAAMGPKIVRCLSFLAGSPGRDDGDRHLRSCFRAAPGPATVTTTATDSPR